MRPSNRHPDQLRPITFQMEFTPYAEGSCLIRCGNTHVLCNATVEEKLPPFLRDSGQGWITAEYGMLPRATHQRVDREAARGKQGGRTVEIQRLIGRCLRSIVDLKVLGERQVRIDCDVLQADGGTRTAAITGAYLALHHALHKMVKAGTLKKMPLTDTMAAISCGIYKGTPVLDLDYAEDCVAETDGNFILTGSGHFVELQVTAEQHPLNDQEFQKLLALAHKGVAEITAKQKEMLGFF